MKKWYLVIVVILVLFPAACTSATKELTPAAPQIKPPATQTTPPGPETTPPETETTPPEPEPEASSKLPEDIIPLNVQGFDFIEKSNRADPIFDGEEYWAYSFFVPKINSQYEGKVESVIVDVHLFRDDTSSKNAFDIMVEAGTSATEIQVNGMKAILTYDADIGKACTIQRQGRLLICSDSVPPFEAFIFDETALKNASVLCLNAATP